MQGKNYVSVWLGNAPDYIKLDEYLSTVYDDRGDPFNAFEHDFFFTFDNDMREADVWKNPGRNIADILKGFSYWESFCLDDVALEKDYTCAVLIYNTNYDGRVRKRADNKNAFEMTKILYPSIELEFIAAIPYEKR